MNRHRCSPGERLTHGRPPGDHGATQGHLGALAGLDLMGPARLRTLLAAMEPEDLWAAMVRRSVDQICGTDPERSGDACRNGPEDIDQSRARAPLFPRPVVEQWCRTAAEHPEWPVSMASRLAGLDVAALGPHELPEPLLEDPDPPGALFCQGARSPGGAPSAAVVGTRRASEYGLRVARCLGAELASAGVVVVSGLALGIDAAAHAGALEAMRGGGAPVAVIGAGHDRPCPSRNRSLARAVSRAGWVISEVPPGVASAPWRFPVRNRLIAALADVVVVVESPSQGGSMSTVSEALARDRPVMAVPGPLGRRSAEGCHDLLRDGAGICTGAGDVLEALALLGHGTSGGADVESPAGSRGAADDVALPDDSSQPDDSSLLVLDLLSASPMTVDQLVASSGMDLMRLASVVSSLEARSMVTREAGFIIRSR